MIEVMLSSAHMGDVDETDFDVWAEFVSERIEEATGLAIQVDQAPFGEAGEDVISRADEHERATVREWLSITGWEAFCGQEWDARRKAREAA
jgi:hypothetical protein